MSLAAQRLALAAASALVLAGCGSTVSGDAKTAPASGSSGTGNATSSSSPAGNTVPAPHQTPNTNTDGTPFDPCLAYSAAELGKWGLDPATVKGVDDGLQRGCIWDGKGWYVQQLVINRSISEYLDTDNYPDAQPLTIAGLQGSQHRLSQPGTGFCSVQIPSQRAVVATLVRVDPEAANKIPDACTKAIEIATDTAAKLPK
ncbi:DUF3558 family protein [Mycobacteroides salmoniphilum]|uniref:DUF3558 domain-containing protein n=1 Tax=Mycobacteroides salmoniphilum TaxID=404941 RepID=A0A4R8SIW0_9MYCO|nr:DUF3558 family protein [Mycobacteroides salmoniphilum]TDZ96877.1 hypothetical protein CCUG60885_03021 [Mycobacteroides salmoniphilum]TEA05972.1 hypothetical protein CCUG60883_03278 [Mycobacteroides salmoniphilum]